MVVHCVVKEWMAAKWICARFHWTAELCVCVRVSYSGSQMKFGNHFIRLAKSEHWFRTIRCVLNDSSQKYVEDVTWQLSSALSFFISAVPLFLPLLKVLRPKTLAFFKITANKVTRYNVLMMVCAIDVSFLKWEELFNFNEKLELRVNPSKKNTKSTDKQKKPSSRCRNKWGATCCCLLPFIIINIVGNCLVFGNWFCLSQTFDGSLRIWMQRAAESWESFFICRFYICATTYNVHVQKVS